MTPAELTTIIGAVAGVIIAVLEAARRVLNHLKQVHVDLATNTRETKGAKAAAERAAEQVDWQQKATALSLEVDDLRRKLALMQSLNECLPCRLKVAEILGAAPIARRRSDPPPATQETRL